MMSAACQYETDVSDAQWELLHPVLPTPIWRPGSRGRPPRPLRRVVNGRKRKPTVSRGVTSAVVGTYGYDDGRIWRTRCAVIAAAPGDR